MGFAPAGITAYHGSPYLFQKLDPGMRGQGQGAQDYGIGAGYVAEARPVAESYRQMAGESGYLYKGDIPDESLPYFIDLDKKLSQQTPEVQSRIKAVWKDLDLMPVWKKDRAGNMKMVDINDLKGNEIYEQITNHFGISDGAEYASGALQEVGLRGIKYLDHESRKAKKGTSNFIPFSPEDYKIQEINDIPLEDYITKGLLAP